MNKEEREKRLVYAKNQFEIAKAYAAYWEAMATTGACKLRKTQQGRQPTEEERAQGLVIGWRDKTDEEKVVDALNTMMRHIHFMSELNDTIHKLMNEQDH